MRISKKIASISDLRQEFDLKASTMPVKERTSFCIDTKLLVLKLVDLLEDDQKAEAEAFNDHVKQVQLDSEISTYGAKWELSFATE